MAQTHVADDYATHLGELAAEIGRTRDYVRDINEGRAALPKGISPGNVMLKQHDAFLAEAQQRLAGMILEWNVVSGANR